MAIITLTTDFGSRDGYVGAMKGVIARLAPEATLVDIAHDIPRGDIAHAAWVVASSTREFPAGTVHLVVVDPGVGGARQAVIGRVPAPAVGEHHVVGPDNGVFGYLAIREAWLIDETACPGPVSATFHGRDVFAPAAALLARGDRSIVGAATTLTGALPWGDRIPFTGRIVHIDVYGNLITDLPADEAVDMIAYDDRRAIPIVRTYESVPNGALLAYVGSAGTIEIAVRDGRADEELGAKRGATITGKPPSKPSQGVYR